MRRVTVANFRSDPHYPRVVAAVTRILATTDVVTPVAVFTHMGLLTVPAIEAWRHGTVPCLERVIQCNLEKAARILRILRMHAHDLNLRPSEVLYYRLGKGPRSPLRFTKFGEPRVEAAYRTHLTRVLSKKRARTNLAPEAPPTGGVPPSPVAGALSKGNTAV
jgi:hypothetical protein